MARSTGRIESWQSFDRLDVFNSGASMLATEVKGLRVIECDADASPYGDPGGIGWRVLVEQINQVLPIKFAREIDAAAAMDAIRDVVDWANCPEHELKAISWVDVRDRMLGALAW